MNASLAIPAVQLGRVHAGMPGMAVLYLYEILRNGDLWLLAAAKPRQGTGLAGQTISIYKLYKEICAKQVKNCSRVVHLVKKS